MKKYILPFLFFLMTFVIIPKEAYYKKGNIDIVATTTEGIWKGYLYLLYPMGYEMEDPWRNVNGKNVLEKNIKNTILDRYIFHVNSPVGEISELKFSSGKKSITIPKGVGQKYFDIPWKDIKKIYTVNILNIFIYFGVILSLSWYYFKKGVEINLKNIGVFSLALVFLSISLNLKWLSKVNGVFLSLTVLKMYLDRKKIKFGYLEITGVLLLLLSLLSEYLNFFNYEKTYIYFQNTILMIIVMKIWSFDYKDKKVLKKYFKISLIVLSLINLISPLVFGGVYTFTFGVLMAILVADSIERLLFYDGNIYNLGVDALSLLLGLYGIITSSRRTMIVALGIYCIYLFIKLLKNDKKKAIILVFLGVVFSSIVISIGFRNEKYRLKELVVSITNTQTDESNIQRLLMWRRGYYIGKENPILGIGVDSFQKEAIKEKYNDIKNSREKFLPEFIHVHNEYIHQVISRGIPGAILFYGIWVYILNRLRKSKDKNFDIMLLIIYGIYGIFDPYSIRAEAIIFYSLIGISFINSLQVNGTKNRFLEKLGFISTIILFLAGFYFNKRFRYYFLIFLIMYLGYYFYNKRKREKYEKI
ncbi:O-antigen ligase family protein [uncultured Cetobacterium sp.]|uniref:O-antigen ligase family protein n=1 Tax=uncultured Cetobacterium sp. TaxID=527638 RepID=UPI0026135641|nr:O-antigen ligase family protein [uncultured Cetobacterium sp.]